MRLKDVIGKEVVTEDGVRIGKVIDAEIENWVVTRLVLQLNRDAARSLGVRLALRPKGSVNPSFVKGVGDYITLSVPSGKLDEALKPE